ncbi:hypothetical protein EST38_g1879 [Candolleomyces aberdarensis]|uniref:Gated mechanosensitive channel n=1 Tax=Candolleomyces aberdarensis TaxID=2316362 RepID=A0A4Q2DTY8_9AGAR|nr:hypothetical protein EST38_g1879 [Candolleomyces aberdarensis]
MASSPWSPQSWDADGARSHLLDAERVVSRKVRSIWDGFVQFALRDSVIEVALGLIIATTFTKVVNSLVSDIILPPISLLPFMAKNLEEKFVVLKKGPHYYDQPGYNTREQALTDGAVIWTYGAFLDTIITFLGVGFSLYFIAVTYGTVTKDSVIKATVKCRFCRKEIGAKAIRCPMCTSWLDGRDDETTAIPPAPAAGQ